MVCRWPCLVSQTVQTVQPATTTDNVRHLVATWRRAPQQVQLFHQAGPLSVKTLGDPVNLPVWARLKVVEVSLSQVFTHTSLFSFSFRNAMENTYVQYIEKVSSRGGYRESPVHSECLSFIKNVIL